MAETMKLRGPAVAEPYPPELLSPSVDLSRKEHTFLDLLARNPSSIRTKSNNSIHALPVPRLPPYHLSHIYFLLHSPPL